MKKSIAASRSTSGCQAASLSTVESPPLPQSRRWSGTESKATGRGAVMAYVPAGDSYWLLYAALETGESWSVTETLDIKRDELASLMEQASDTIQSI
jgi:hypothetical protein